MTRKTLILATMTVVGCFTGLAAAQPTIDWYTVDGGGGTSTGGQFTLSGTIGQPDAGTMSGGSFTLLGGFWSGSAGSSGGCTVTCDYNQDGGADTSDVLDLANDIASGTESFPGSCSDYNQDGGADTSDVLDLANDIAAGTCA